MRRRTCAFKTNLVLKPGKSRTSLSLFLHASLLLLFPWIGVVFFTAVKNFFTSEWKQRPRKSTFQVLCLLRKTVRNTGCSVRGFWVIISRFSRPSPRKSLDNHSKTSHRASCFPHSFLEVVELENYYLYHTCTNMTLYLFDVYKVLDNRHFLCGTSPPNINLSLFTWFYNYMNTRITYIQL